MDIGAFMQSLTGESMVPTGSGVADKTNMMGRWKPSQDIAVDDGNISFLQTVHQILGKIDGGGGTIDEGGEGSERASSDVSQAVLLLEILGQGDIGTIDLGCKAIQDQATEGSETDLLALLNEQLSALETSITESATVINDGTLNDAEKTLSILRTAMGQILGQDQTQQLKEKAESLQSDKMVVGTQDQLLTADAAASMVGDIAVEAPTDETMSCRALREQAPVDFLKEPTNTVPDAGSNQLVPEKAEPSDSKVNSAKTLVQTLMSQSDMAESQQASDQPASERNAEKSQTFEWAGLKKEPLTGESTLTGQPQDVPSLQKQDEPLFSNEKVLSEIPRQHQASEHEPAKGNTPENGKTDALLNDSMKVALSNDSTIDSKPLTTSTTTNTPTLASGDTAFQKAVMDQIVEKATIRFSNDRSEMHIQLKPDTLGDVRMSIVSEKNQLVVRMIADKSETKEIIESQIHHLKAELDKQGITVGKIEVMISAGNDQQESREQFFQMFKNNAFGSGKRQSDGQQQEQTAQHQNSGETDSDPSGDGINYFV